MPISMMTKRNSIMIAPVYTTICATPRKGALFAMYRTARPSMTPTMQMTECAAFFMKRTPRAQPTMKMAVHAKRMISPVDPIMGQPLDRFISVSPSRLAPS